MWIIILFFAFNSSVYAQNRVTEYNSIGWYALFINAKISENFRGYFEIQARRTDIVDGWQQWFPRTGVTYLLNDYVSFLVGYAWIQTYPYGETTISQVEKVFPEHRTFQQILAKIPIGKVTLQNRFRLEQRWIGSFDSMGSDSVDNWVYINRIRYMSRVDVQLFQDSKWYVALSDEIFMNLGSNVGENIFDQNRISALIGYKFYSGFSLEGGYINQILQLGREVAGRNLFQNNNGILINAYVTID